MSAKARGVTGNAKQLNSFRQRTWGQRKAEIEPFLRGLHVVGLRTVRVSLCCAVAGWLGYLLCVGTEGKFAKDTFFHIIFTFVASGTLFRLSFPCPSFTLCSWCRSLLAPSNWQRPMGIKLAPRRLGEGKGAAADGSVIIIKYIPSFSFAQKAISHSVAGPQSHNRRATATVWFDAFMYEYATERAEKGP